MPTTPNSAPQLHFFFFNVAVMPNLIPFSSAEMNDGIEPVLKRLEHKEVKTYVEHMKLYESELCNDRFLAILHTPLHTYIFHIHDLASLYAWKVQYESIPTVHLAQKLLPPPSAPPVQIEIPMNKKVLRQR